MRPIIHRDQPTTPARRRLATGFTLLEVLFALLITGGLLWGELKLERVQFTTLNHLNKSLSKSNHENPWREFSSTSPRCTQSEGGTGPTTKPFNFLICGAEHAFVVVP